MPTDDLKRSLEKLEAHLAHLQARYGDRLPEMRDIDGNYIVQPILTALVNGYAALHNVKL